MKKAFCSQSGCIWAQPSWIPRNASMPPKPRSKIWTVQSPYSLFFCFLTWSSIGAERSTFSEFTL